MDENLGQLMKDQRDLVEVGEEAVERARIQFSKQPRFSDNGTSDWSSMYTSLYGWVKLGMDEIREEPYSSNSLNRDKWLREFWKLEPHWAGIINNTILIDSARPWTFIGGKKQVNRYVPVMHNANNGKGWRHFFRQSSLSYRVTDMGSVTELGRAGMNGPLRAIYHVDSARCRWSGKVTFPLYYYPASRSNRQKWRDSGFFNVTSLPSDDEKLFGLGYSATSRAFQLVRLLYGMLQHDAESMGVKMMKGLLLLNGIEQDQWERAMEAREAQLKGDERKYFGGVYILASLGAGDIDAKLVSLSQLPKDFNRQTFQDQVIFGYAMVMGYDPREFWPVSAGSLGTARETEMQHRKSATKGTLEYPHAWQERFQQELPETLLFSFEDRDTDAEVIEAQMAKAWAEVARVLYDSDPHGERPGLLEQEQVLSLLVDHKIIPPEWTAAEESVVQSDEKSKALKRQMWRERILSNPDVRRAVERFGNEPVIAHTWTPTKSYERVVYERADEVLRPQLYAVHRKYPKLGEILEGETNEKVGQVVGRISSN